MHPRILTITDLHLGQREKCFGVSAGQISLLSKPAASEAEGHRRHSWLASVCSELSRRGGGSDNPVELVVTGDLLDLSLARFDIALEDLGHLLASLPQVDTLTWVVGNHDHHVWTLHGEYVRVLEPMGRGALPDPTPLLASPADEPCSAPWISGPVSAIAGREINVRLAYPVYRRRVGRVDATGKQTELVFTHGHLCGGLTTFFGTVLGKHASETSGRAEVDAAVANAPLIEFIYWVLGRTGHGLGGEGFIEHLYIDSQRGERKLLDELTQDLADELGKRVSPGSRSVATALRWFSSVAGDALVNWRSGSEDRHKPLEDVRKMIRGNLRAAGVDPEAPTLLFFGHTHHADRFEIEKQGLAYNLGTWLVEPGRPPLEPVVAAIYAAPDDVPDLRIHEGGVLVAPPQVCSWMPPRSPR